MENRSAAALVVTLVLAACGGKVTEVHPGQGEVASSDPTPPPEPVDPDPGAEPPSNPGPPPPTPSPPAAPCGASFRTEIMPIFVAHTCTNVSCHGGQSPRNMPGLDPAHLNTTWTTLRAFTLSDGRPYVVNAPDPTLSGMYCSVRGECGVSMLPFSGAGFDAKEYAAIDSWLACGAPFN